MQQQKCKCLLFKSLNTGDVVSIVGFYLHNVLRHCGHVLGEDDDDGPRRLPESLLVFLVGEIRQSHHHAATA